MCIFCPTKFPRVSIGFSSIVLITGFYKSGLQAFLKAKVDAEKKAKEDEQGGAKLTVNELRLQNAELEQRNKQLQDEVDTLRELIEDNESGSTHVLCVLRR